MRKKMTVILICFFVNFTFANDLQLLVRSSYLDGFQLPAQCFFLDTKPVMNQHFLWFKVTCYKDPMHSEIWKYDLINKKSQLVTRSQPYHLFSEITTDGKNLWWHEFNDVFTTSLNTFHHNVLKVYFLPDLYKYSSVFDFMPGANSWMRMRTENGVGLYSWEKEQILPITFQRDLDINYIFSLSFLNGKDIIFKARSGSDLGEERPDRILLVRNNDEPKVLLQDRDTDSTSPYFRFRNQVITYGKTWSVMAARIEGEVLVIGDEERTHLEIPLYLYFKSIPFFSWALGAHHSVILRAQHHGDEHEALWLISGHQVHKIVDCHQVIMTDQGRARAICSRPFSSGVTHLNNQAFVALSLEMIDRPDLTESMGLFSVDLGQLTR